MGKYEVVMQMTEVWSFAKARKHKGHVLWATYDAFQKDLARYVGHKSNWMQRVSQGTYQLRACTAEQLKIADASYIASGERGFKALMPHPKPLSATASSSRNMVLSAAADACQEVNPKSIEVEPYLPKPRFSRGAEPKLCGAGSGCPGCGTAARAHPQGNKRAGLFFPRTGGVDSGGGGDDDEDDDDDDDDVPDGDSSVRAKKQAVLAKFSVGNQCGFVEMSLEQACWGPRACVLHHYGDQVGTKRTKLWIVDKGDPYAYVMAHHITKKLRVYG
jgi:hypothetical protein